MPIVWNQAILKISFHVASQTPRRGIRDTIADEWVADVFDIYFPVGSTDALSRTLDEPSGTLDESSMIVEEPSRITNAPSTTVDTPSRTLGSPSTTVDTPSTTTN